MSVWQFFHWSLNTLPPNPLMSLYCVILVKMFIKFLQAIISVIVRNLRLFYVLISCHVHSSIFSKFFFSKENLNFLLCHLKKCPIDNGATLLSFNGICTFSKMLSFHVKHSLGESLLLKVMMH